MDEDAKLTSATRIKRIRVQGYTDMSDAEISGLAFGNRFAYIVCTSILLVGIVTANIPILATMMAVAFLGVVLPNHPFDYLYNHLVRNVLDKPELPPRSNQLKFACGIATVWIGTTIYLFYSGFTLAGYIAGGMLFSVAFLVSAFDFCIPSIIYNFLFGVRSGQR